MRARKTLVAGLAAAALCAAPAASFAYGPGGGPAGAPPGFGPTLTSCTAGPDSCTASGDYQKCHIKVMVPQGTFARRVNVVISKIKNSDADKHLSRGHISVCAFGVGFFRDGNLIHVAAGRPSVKIAISGDPIAATDHLYLLIPGGSQPKPATVSLHLVTSTLRATRELAVVRTP